MSYLEKGGDGTKRIKLSLSSIKRWTCWCWLIVLTWHKIISITIYLPMTFLVYDLGVLFRMFLLVLLSYVDVKHNTVVISACYFRYRQIDYDTNIDYL